MKEYKNILIIGAGEAGRLLLKDIQRHHHDCKVIGFIDDIKKENGINVLGTIDELSRLNKIYRVSEMVIAIPSTDGELVRKILLKNIKNRIPIKIVPRNQRVIGFNNVKYSEVQNIDLEDFLGRPFVNKNVEKLRKFYKGKTVLVTGGAGSIGSGIVQQLIDLEVKKVVVYDNSEYLIFNLDQSLQERGVRSKCKLVIGSILNKNKLDLVIKKEIWNHLFLQILN